MVEVGGHEAGACSRVRRTVTGHRQDGFAGEGLGAAGALEKDLDGAPRRARVELGDRDVGEAVAVEVGNHHVLRPDVRQRDAAE